MATTLSQPPIPTPSPAPEDKISVPTGPTPPPRPVSNSPAHETGLEAINPDPRAAEFTSLPEVVSQHDTPAPTFSTVPTPSALTSQPSISYHGSPPPTFDKAIQEGYRSPPMMPQQQNINPHMSQTITPLHLLGTQSDTVDCPFCQRRSTTTVKKSPSAITHAVGVSLFFVSFCGAVAPYMCHWFSHTVQYCENCGRKLTYRAYGSKQPKVYGTPEHLREVSRFPAA